jgi:hypothetical protein
MGGYVSSATDKSGESPSAAAAAAEQLRQEVQRLRAQVGAAEAAIRTLRDRCGELEESKAHLTRMAVASAQLHESADEGETLCNLLDLLVNLIGTEEMAIWRLSADGRALELRASQGIDAQRWNRIPVDEGPLGKAVSSGEIVVEAEPGKDGPSVGVPLLVGRRPVGVAAVFRLLPHRSTLGPQDADVFRMISQQAGFALCCADESWDPGRRLGNG